MKYLMAAVALVVLSSCGQNVKKERSADNNNVRETTLAGAAILVKRNDSLTGNHASNGSKKLSCCVAPPSRFINAKKKLSK